MVHHTEESLMLKAERLAKKTEKLGSSDTQLAIFEEFKRLFLQKTGPLKIFPSDLIKIRAAAHGEYITSPSTILVRNLGVGPEHIVTYAYVKAVLAFLTQKEVTKSDIEVVVSGSGLELDS